MARRGGHWLRCGTIGEAAKTIEAWLRLIPTIAVVPAWSSAWPSFASQASNVSKGQYGSPHRMREQVGWGDDLLAARRFATWSGPRDFSQLSRQG